VASKGSDWLLLVHNETDKPEGCVVAFTYPNGTGWVGFFIVNAHLRQHGLGRMLWKNLEAKYQSSGTTIVGLDGVQEQVKTYERRGYKDIARIPLMMRASLREHPLHDKYSLEGQVTNIKLVDPKLLAELDLALNGLDRRALWTQEALFSRTDTYGYVLLDDQKVLGYILVRRCEHGHRFGPLYAKTYDQARLLLLNAMYGTIESQGSMVAEIFGSNPKGKTVFEELGWTWAGIDYHRMWLGGRVPKEQDEDGRGTKEMFATFDASEG
jgi:hypothetical protein